MIDLDLYKATLHREAGAVFRRIVADLAEEGPYSLALYNSGDSWGYLFPTVSTRRGLQAAFEAYKAEGDPFNTGLSDAELWRELKWSPCDSPRHEDYADTLVETERLLSAYSDAFYDSLDESEDAYFDRLHEQLVEGTLDVLARLRAEGAFAGLDPDTLVLNLLNGDQSDEERLERARRLNPDAAYRGYASDLAET